MAGTVYITPALFKFLRDLKKNNNCWENCGIVKVKITLEETVVDGRR